ncbi:MAG: IPTL-CTERM sorting domain-containing protein [Casimicrobiaceae bacterium]
MNKKLRPVVNMLAAVLLTAYATAPALADIKAPAAGNLIGPQAVVSTTNGILTLLIENASTSDLGMFSVSTGAAHPNPNQLVLYPVGTSYITLNDVTSSITYANVSGATPATGFTFQNMSMAPGSGVVSVIAGGYRTVWTLPTWTVTQDVVINGSTLSDTNVRQSATVCNTTGATRQYGLRFMWDWDIAGNDASFFRQRNPDTAYTNVFATFTNPGFQLFEEVNNLSTPLFSVFGTVGGGPLTPVPTQPEQLRYSSWGTAYSAAWDFANTGSGADSATEHYWGLATPLSLAAGGCATYTQYLTTNLNAAGGGGGVAVNIAVPTLSTWGLLLLITLIGGISLWSIRRRLG